MADRLVRYTQLIARSDLMEEIAQRVAEGEPLASLCKAWDVPIGRVKAWLVSDLSRQDLYESAQRFYADAIAAETVVIADEGAADVSHANLRIKARQWLAGKWDRARYGDALQVQHTGETVVRLTFGERTVAQVPALVGQSSAAEWDV